MFFKIIAKPLVVIAMVFSMRLFVAVMQLLPTAYIIDKNPAAFV